MEISSTIFQLAILLVAVYVHENSAQSAQPNFANCRQDITASPRIITEFRSPNYPFRYNGGQSCQFNLVAPPGYQVILRCQSVRLASSSDCVAGDYLDVSRSGGSDVGFDQRYCSGFTTNSYTNRLTLSLVSPGGPGGIFTCQTYSAPGCDCGRSQNTRIVGGTPAGINMYPSMAALFNKNTGEEFCGGTIIDAKYILTAAHCVIGMQDPSSIVVGVGTSNLLPGQMSPRAAKYSVRRIIPHFGYNSDNNANDIALIELNNPLVFSEAVGPACVPFSMATDLFVGEEVTALGYGQPAVDLPATNNLNMATLNVISTNDCNRMGAKFNYAVTQAQLCTYTPGKDSCQRDSGGPLLRRSPQNGLEYVEGIQSFAGNGCALEGIPGVNTRVGAYLNWIRSNAPNAQFCPS